MTRLTEAQRAVLKACDESNGLHRYSTSRWNWYRRHEGGYTSKAATNPTVSVLIERGFLMPQPFDHVIITDAGRKALAA